MDAPGAMDFLGPPPTPETALAALAGPVRRWFRQAFGAPTPAQCLAWPTLAAGNHLLLCAPTGSGKTLAAFLPILGRLLEEGSARALTPGVRCLYVAPLKALGNDARKNLKESIQGIRRFAHGTPVPIRVGLRTGDTSARVRQRQRLRPPDLLLTTPESLAVLLSQPPAASLFGPLRWVVVDEVHALAPVKRGADLALSLERLEDLASGGGLQRIGLSATCAPVETAARFLAGSGRACTVAQAPDRGRLDLTVEPLEGDESGPGRTGFLARLVTRLEPELVRNRTTLVFTNARGLAERLAWALRQHFPDRVERVAVHHSALARARRREAEARLKKGDLWVVVSSTSLELGIDVGTVDGVVLVHPPGGVVRLLQRVGRSGHGPGRVRRGLVLTATPAELLEAAVTGASGHSAQVEPLHVPSGPLDVLCQQLLGMAAGRPWSATAAFACVRRAYPYRDLSRADFDACLHYLSGRTSDGRPWLPARLHWDGEQFRIADERTARLLRRNIGTILAEEPRAVRLLNGDGSPERGAPEPGRSPHHLPLTTPLGQVDESFADRLRPGDRFLLDGRCLEYRRGDGAALLVEEVVGRPVVPRWAGEGWPLSRDLARRLYWLRVQAAEALLDGPEPLAHLLENDYGLRGPAVATLVAHFQRQESLSEIPGPGGCLVEAVPGEGGVDYYVHTPLNRAGNDALTRAVVLRLARERGLSVQSLVADLGFGLFTRSAAVLGPDDWRVLFAAEGFDADLAEAVAAGETLRERFRRTALTGLMLLRHPLGRKRRVGGQDWAERRLFHKVREADPDFVLLRQAAREVCEECCDAGAARAFLHDLPRRAVRWRRLGQVSPFARNWTQVEPGPVEAIETVEEALERLHATLFGDE